MVQNRLSEIQKWAPLPCESEPWWGAHVVMLNRKSGRAEEAEKKLLEEAPGSKVASIFRMLKICEDCEICEIYVF